MSSVTAVVTTARRFRPAAECEALSLSARLGGRYEPRQDRSLTEAIAAASGLPLVVVEETRVVCHCRGSAFFFHPGLARMRLDTAAASRPEPLLTALALPPGGTVLDTTLGRAVDAIVASAAVGETGQVTGLEIHPVVAALVGLGLSTYEGPTPAITAAMRRIRVLCADYREYLMQQPDDSYDAVYFDPMFDEPLPGCSSIEPLRSLASYMPLAADAVREACRVARHRVVVKVRRGADTLDRLGIAPQPAGRSTRVLYGVIDVVARSGRR